MNKMGVWVDGWKPYTDQVPVRKAMALGGWVGGLMDGIQSLIKDCLQQSKIIHRQIARKIDLIFFVKEQQKQISMSLSKFCNKKAENGLL